MRINVRVFAATKHTTKTEKTMYRQLVQIDQANKPSVSVSRTYFEEDRVLPPGDYTAAVSFYTYKHTDVKTGFVSDKFGAALGDFQKA